MTGAEFVRPVAPSKMPQKAPFNNEGILRYMLCPQDESQSSSRIVSLFVNSSYLCHYLLEWPAKLFLQEKAQTEGSFPAQTGQFSGASNRLYAVLGATARTAWLSFTFSLPGSKADFPHIEFLSSVWTLPKVRKLNQVSFCVNAQCNEPYCICCVCL